MKKKKKTEFQKYRSIMAKLDNTLKKNDNKNGITKNSND